MRIGSVALVGAGPGPAEFLTLAAAEAIAAADVILYDALIGPDVRRLFPQKAQTTYVGKRCGQHALGQQEISALMVQAAREGSDVVRLKGGDPLIFGRVAEELAALRAAGVPYRVVPGISALNGLAALYALPLTDRAQSHEFRVIQGHHLDPHPRYWHELALYEGTLVIYMGLEQLELILTRLLNFGAPQGRPIAVIESSSAGLSSLDGESSELTRSTLAALLHSGFQRRTAGPGIVYIGPNVASMDEKPFASAESRHDEPQSRPVPRSRYASSFTHFS